MIAELLKSFKPGTFVSVSTCESSSDLIICYIESASVNTQDISFKITFDENLTETVRSEIECANLMKE